MREARAEELGAIGALAARAMRDDPMFAYLTPDAATRARVTPVHLTAFVRAVAVGGKVWVDDDLTATACWRKPGARDITPDEGKAGGLDRLGEVLGEDALARLGAIFDHVDARVAALGLPDHWYLVLLAVEPALAGRGLGSAALAPVLARADADGVPCYLETMEETNVGFYERHGFHVAETDVEPSSGLTYWLMVRDPR